MQQRKEATERKGRGKGVCAVARRVVSSDTATQVQHLIRVSIADVTTPLQLKYAEGEEECKDAVSSLQNCVHSSSLGCHSHQLQQVS